MQIESRIKRIEEASREKGASITLQSSRFSPVQWEQMQALLTKFTRDDAGNVVCVFAPEDFRTFDLLQAIGTGTARRPFDDEIFTPDRIAVLAKLDSDVEVMAAAGRLQIIPAMFDKAPFFSGQQARGIMAELAAVQPTRAN